MKHYNLLIALGLFIGLSSCSQESKNNEVDNNKVEINKANLPLIDTTSNNVYQEWYEGHEQIKIKGHLDKNNLRHGIWKFYNEEGKERGITDYSHGKKNGSIVIYYPNGSLKYKGEYTMDKQSGEWIFYNADGSVAEIKNYNEKN